MIGQKNIYIYILAFDWFIETGLHSTERVFYALSIFHGFLLESKICKKLLSFLCGTENRGADSALSALNQPKNINIFIYFRRIKE